MADTVDPDAVAAVTAAPEICELDELHVCLRVCRMGTNSEKFAAAHGPMCLTDLSEIAIVQGKQFIKFVNDEQTRTTVLRLFTGRYCCLHQSYCAESLCTTPPSLVACTWDIPCDSIDICGSSADTEQYGSPMVNILRIFHEKNDRKTCGRCYPPYRTSCFRRGLQICADNSEGGAIT